MILVPKDGAVYADIVMVGVGGNQTDRVFGLHSLLKARSPLVDNPMGKAQVTCRGYHRKTGKVSRQLSQWC